MKKNNKYRSNNNYSNNNNTHIFSLNYKFDSISAAGKISGTALDLIKRYNELAKEAHGNADYVEAENFRQYAEHYRKIVTDINERAKAQNPVAKEEKPAPVIAGEKREETPKNAEAVAPEAAAQMPTTAPMPSAAPAAPISAAAPVAPRREFKIVEISSSEAAATSAKAPRGRPARNTRKPKTEAAAL